MAPVGSLGECRRLLVEVGRLLVGERPVGQPRCLDEVVDGAPSVTQCARAGAVVGEPLHPPVDLRIPLQHVCGQCVGVGQPGRRHQVQHYLTGQRVRVQAVRAGTGHGFEEPELHGVGQRRENRLRACEGALFGVQLPHEIQILRVAEDGRQFEQLSGGRCERVESHLDGVGDRLRRTDRRGPQRLPNLDGRPDRARAPAGRTGCRPSGPAARPGRPSCREARDFPRLVRRGSPRCRVSTLERREVHPSDAGVAVQRGERVEDEGRPSGPGAVVRCVASRRMREIGGVLDERTSVAAARSALAQCRSSRTRTSGRSPSDGPVARPPPRRRAAAGTPCFREVDPRSSGVPPPVRAERGGPRRSRPSRGGRRRRRRRAGTGTPCRQRSPRPGPPRRSPRTRWPPRSGAGTCRRRRPHR